MSKTSERGRVLQPGDLIDDRELNTADRDRLDHDRIADELVDLVTTVEMPTNIALYGPWGSGKSGIANLIRTKVEADQKARAGVRFARFDAFKYADIPLRRNFIAAIAGELNVKDDRYGRDLYAGKTKTSIDVPNESKAQIVGWFFGLTAVLSTLLVALLALLTLLQPGSWKANFAQNFSAALPVGLISPAVLAAVFTLVGKTLTVDRSVDRPDSVEQFEDLFKDLVHDSKAKRLVIFVDELDRCTAKEVVATLDAIRTFLGVNKCVFVVAADQHVLEQALSEEARQETPTDSVNPYYSTGSAYLDKVFQYQVSLPPLLPQSVTEFAIKAVENRTTGLWHELAPVDYVLSVLIPSHVTSPRRVKHLMNTFALTYRLAASKHAAGGLQEDPNRSSLAIARLVCLRVEFPNFARDLTLDPKMPTHVLALFDDRDADLGERVSPHVRERALSYATGQASPARLLARPDPDDAEDENDPEQDNPASDDHDDNSVATESPQTDARSQQGRQLLNYLTRTRLIDGPSRDLIYMRSVGSVYDLPEDLAADLASALDNGLFDEVARLYGDADPDVQPKVVLFIAGQIGATYGIERTNAAHALLDLAQREDLPNLHDVANTAGQAIAAMHSSGEPVLTADSLPGAWALSTADAGDGAVTLRRISLRYLDEQHDWDGTYLFDQPVVALDTDPVPATNVMARELVSGHATTVAAALQATDGAVALRVLNAIRTTAGRNLAELFEEFDRHKKAREETAQAASAGTAEPGTATDDPAEPLVTIIVDALTDLSNHWAEDHRDLSWIVIHILLLGEHESARTRVARLLPKIGQTSEHQTAQAVLRSILPRPLSQWPTWLQAIPADILKQSDDQAVSAVIVRLFDLATKADDTTDDEVIRQAVAQAARLVENRPADTVDLTPKARTLLKPPVTDDAIANQRIWTLNRIQNFEAAGLVDPSATAAHEITNMRQTLQAGYPEQPETGAISAYFVRYAPALTDALTDDEATNEDDPSQSPCLLLAQEVNSAATLSERLRTETATAVLANAPTALGSQARSQAISTEQLEAFITLHGQDASRTVQNWLRLTEPDRATTQRILNAARSHGGVTNDIASAANEVVQSWNSDERDAILDHYVADPGNNIDAPAFLRAIRFTEADPETIAASLVKRFQATGNNNDRDTVITLWGKTPTSPDQATTLYSQMLIPWLKMNTNGSHNADAVRRALHAVRGLATDVPADLRNEFAQVVTDATDGDKGLSNAAVPVLEDRGYQADVVGKIRKRLEVKDD